MISVEAGKMELCMHEWALAEGVITTALNTPKTEGMQHITKIVVSIGQLQQIEADIFAYAIKQVMPVTDPPLVSTDLTLKTVPAVFRCRIDDHEFTFDQAAARLSAEESEATIGNPTALRRTPFAAAVRTLHHQLAS